MIDSDEFMGHLAICGIGLLVCAGVVSAFMNVDDPIPRDLPPHAASFRHNIDERVEVTRKRDVDGHLVYISRSTAFLSTTMSAVHIEMECSKCVEAQPVAVTPD